jgi:hypothetical protein
MCVLLMAGFVGLSTSDRILTSFGEKRVICLLTKGKLVSMYLLKSASPLHHSPHPSCVLYTLHGL